MKRTSAILTGLAAVAIACSNASAAATVLNAYENSDVVTGFNLNFPGLGIDSTSNVFYTRYQLEIDEDAGTARFVNYEQEIEPLLLPLGISTGRLSVRITSSEGTYDKATRTFRTNDVYEIRFTNDLSTFGFETPVNLPAVSSGKLDAAVGNVQHVEMNWSGDGELQNESKPDEPYQFTYSCKVNTTIAASAAEVPPLPTRSLCADGVFGIFGLAASSLMFAGLKVSNRRYRRQR